MLVSVDGRAYHDLGDLVTVSRKHSAPPQGKYAIHRYVADKLETHGRYVKLIVNPGGAFFFVDEIEISRGDEACLARPLPGKEIRYPMEYFADTILNASVKRRIGSDLETARAAIVAASLSDGRKARLLNEVKALEQAISELPDVDPKTFRAVFPLNPVHARVFALHGVVRAALGKPPLVVWGAVPWDFLKPAELPEPAPKAGIFFRSVVRVMSVEPDWIRSVMNAVNSDNCWV